MVSKVRKFSWSFSDVESGTSSQQNGWKAVLRKSGIPGEAFLLLLMILFIIGVFIVTVVAL